MQTVLEVEAQKHTGQGAQTVLAPHAPNKTIGPPDNLEIGATHPRSAAQVAQHISKTTKPVKHQGMSQQNMFRQKKLVIYTEDQHWVTYEHHLSHWHKPVDREIAPKRWMNRLPKAPTISNTHTSALSKPKTQLGTNKGRQDQVGGNETQVSPKQLQKAFHISHIEQKVNVTTKAASQNQRSETAPPASRHTVRQRTQTNTNEMGKQTRASKTKRNLQADSTEGKLPQPLQFLLNLNTDSNSTGTSNAINQLMSAASPQTDASMTLTGIGAEEPETTLPGVEEGVEEKRDHQSEQVEADGDQTMSSVEVEHTNSQGASAASATIESPTQNAPASPLHVERSQIVDGSPTKSSDFIQPEWEIPSPNASDINPRSDLPGIRAQLLREGNDADKLISLRLHREQLEALDPQCYLTGTHASRHTCRCSNKLWKRRKLLRTLCYSVYITSARLRANFPRTYQSQTHVGWLTKSALKPRKRTSERVKAAEPS